MADGITIELMNGTPSFSETTTTARNTGELREKLSLPSGTVINVNGVGDNGEGNLDIPDSTPDNPTYVAIVRDNKTGG